MKFLGFGRRRGDEPAPEGVQDWSHDSVLPDGTYSSRPLTPGEAARIDLLDQIKAFLIDHALDITPRNLMIAHKIFSGANLRFGDKVAQRQFSGEPITQQWLDETMAEAEDQAEREELAKMVSQLSQSLGSFAQTAREATQATASYNEDMEGHASDMEAMGEAMDDGTSVDIRALTRLTRAMMERTWQVEEDMRRSEREAAALRRKLERARADASIDYLTGLPNRRSFEHVFDEEYRKARAEIDDLTIAICDIDHFKGVNDTHGHDTGDRVIQHVAGLFLQISDQDCHVARHGGEEFVLLFRGVNAETAHARLDKARENFAQRHLVDRETNNPIGCITFSGGVADVFAYDQPREAMRAADKALYMAKRQGRNRIVIAAP
ncbi:MAG: GGDEF domain-containing protein [Sphingomonadales bacterium]|nr:GGDEF domain-containing protein [Sphingomonadales bacterium]MDE2168548.1 GGDEF domain-containing protein [Sphingomonadales bacterium]